MTKIKLRHVHTFKDRHGKWRHYYRRHGKRVSLPGTPGSAEFMAAYAAADADHNPPTIGASRTKPGSINELVVRYYESARFKRLAPITQSTYRNIVERFRERHGDKMVATIQEDHVRRMIDARAATPAAANNYLEMIGVLMRYAVKLRMRRDDPTANVDKVRITSTGYHTWTEQEIAAFRERHPVGTKARLALDLLLYTAQRRSDVVRMGPADVVKLDGADHIRLRQQKTGTALDIPIHPALAASIVAMSTTGLRTFLVTDYGKTFSAAGFGNWFRDRCDEAGLSHCTAHGLRKALATLVANAGGTGHEIKAMTGHRNLAEVDTYTRAADQRRNARAAMDKLHKAGK